MNERSQTDLGTSSVDYSSKLTTFGSSITSRWNLLSSSQRARALYAAVGLVIVVGVLAWWVFRPSWTILYSGLSPDEARQIGVLLTTANLTYDVSTDGTVLRVPAEQLDKARLTSASKASGQSGRLGYELFDKPDWAGSDFDEKVNYQRALEGELEKTIDSLTAVQSSSVHLVLPHESLFADAQRDSKASVVVRLKSETLTQPEADSIRYLVANAVDDLSPQNVALVDADGRDLGEPSKDSSAKELYEHSLADHILQALEPIAGSGNVHAIVSVDYDLSSHDTVNEDYDPSSVVTLSMQRAEQTSGGSIAAVGVPGTASNTPSPQKPLFPSQKGDAQSSKQESGTYGASRKTEHSLLNAGSIRRVSAAVVVNDRIVASKDPRANVDRSPWTPGDLKQLTNLAQAAIGFDVTRGDTVVVQNLHFEATPVVKENVLRSVLRHFTIGEPVVKDIAVALVGLCAVLFVLRPAILLVNSTSSGPRLLQSTGQAVSPQTANNIASGGETRGLFDQVVTQIQADPTQSARLLQTWIRTE